MNALRNIFNCSARGISLLRQNGTNALFNNFLNQQPVDGISQQASLADVGKNEQPNIAAPSLIPKSILEAVNFKGKQFTSHGTVPGSLSPTSVKRLRRMQQKVKLVYLCKLCNTRNTKEVSEAAYRNGVVILQCDGCAVNHLICDNLGWFADTRGKNFEQVLNERAGERRVKVIKVNERGELI